MKLRENNDANPLQIRNFAANVRIVERADGDDATRTLAGVGMQYGDVYENMWGEFEQMRAGCFTESLKSNTFICWSHEMENLLGSTNAKTARIEDSAKELAVECDVPDTQCGNDTYTLVERGDVEGMSVAFWLQEYEIKRTKGELDQFIITKADLVEVSFVPNPAYKATSASVLRATPNLRSPFFQTEADSSLVVVRVPDHERNILSVHEANIRERFNRLRLRH